MLVAIVSAYFVIAALMLWFLWHTREVEPTTAFSAIRDAILWFPILVFIILFMIYLGLEASYLHFRKKRNNPATRLFQD